MFALLAGELGVAEVAGRQQPFQPALPGAQLTPGGDRQPNLDEAGGRQFCQRLAQQGGGQFQQGGVVADQSQGVLWIVPALQPV